jgi:hypothetical protein
MANTHEGQGTAVFFRTHQLLPKIHHELYEKGMTHDSTVKEKYTV